MKKMFIALIAAILVLTSLTAFADEEVTDFSGMTVQEWYDYEYYMDYNTIFTDITSYDHDYVRNTIVPLHWGGYFAVADETGDVTEEDKLAAVQALHDARINAPVIGDPAAKRIYLWEKGNVPSVTEYTENPGFVYTNSPDFEPFMLECLVDESVEPKGAVLLCAGGGFNYRSNVEEGLEVANAFNALGYQCFIVNYRVKPYTADEGSIDLARAIRIVRQNADKYRISQDSIAAAGFSAGGMCVTNTADNFYGDINASAIVDGYTPDETDAYSADLNAVLCIYSYIRGEDGPAKTFNNPSFPAIFFAVGDDDGLFPTVAQAFVNTLEAGVVCELHTFSGAPHGFGAGTHASGVTYENAAMWTELADVFMQNVYAK